MFARQSIFQPRTVPGTEFHGAVHDVNVEPVESQPAANPAPSGPATASRILTTMLSNIHPNDDQESNIIRALLTEVHSEGSLAARIDGFVAQRRAKLLAGFCAEAERLNLECRQQNSKCDELKAVLAENQQWFKRLSDELQRAKFALETARGEGLPRWPLPEESAAKEKRVSGALSEVKKLEKSHSDAGEAVREATRKLVKECEKLKDLDERRARSEAFGKGEPYQDPETHLPILPPV